jgi:pyruvate kinase
MNYRIVATLGPSSSTPEIWQKMLVNGVTGFRLNTSHLELDQILVWLEQLSGLITKEDPPIPFVLDLQGSKWRIGQINRLNLAADQEIELFYSESSQLPSMIPVPHSDFFLATAMSSDQIVLNDAKVILSRIESGPDWLKARVVRGGELSSRKGITYVDSNYRNERLTEKDRGIFDATRDIPHIQYALSYVRDEEEMARYREIFGSRTPLIAKIERPTALKDVYNISNSADALWLCRGDLGAELGPAGMAHAVSNFTRVLRTIPIPILMAGQVLEHMSFSPQPTRTEVCYLLDCLDNGYMGFVLSDETAIGKFPVESCEAAALFKS